MFLGLGILNNMSWIELSLVVPSEIVEPISYLFGKCANGLSIERFGIQKFKIIIEIDPGLAFGTGHHPTTLMCLERLEELVFNGMNVLDLGVGSGILTVAAAKLGADTILAIDTDPIAIRVASEAIRINNVASKVTLDKRDISSEELLDANLDLAVANISAKVIQSYSKSLFKCLKNGGKLVASGFLDEQEGEVKDSLTKAGFLVENRCIIEDWVTLTLVK